MEDVEAKVPAKAPQAARCKFTVTKVEPTYPGAAAGAAAGEAKVQLNAVYDPELVREDEAFSTATPWGFMEFQVSNPNLADFFKEGQAYYVDITPVE